MSESRSLAANDDTRKMLGADREVTKTTRARDRALRSSRERAPEMYIPCPHLVPGAQDTKVRGGMKLGTVMTRLWNSRRPLYQQRRSGRVLGCPHRSPTPYKARRRFATWQGPHCHWPLTGHWRQVTQSADQHTPPFDTPGPGSRRRTSDSQLVQSWPSLNTRAGPAVVTCSQCHAF